MARQVLPWVGAAIGGYFGGPQGAQIGFMIGSLVGNAVDPQIIKGPKLGEAGLQTSAEGVFRPIVMGTGAVKGNVICRGNRKVKKKRTSQGKGGGPKTEEERVYWTFAIRICEAPEEGTINLLRVWQDEKLVYDRTSANTIPEETEEFEDSFKFYRGEETQLPDSDLEAFIGIGNVPAYRGSVYAVFPNMDLTDTGERIPDFRWEVSTTVTQFSWDYTWDGPHLLPNPELATFKGHGVYSKLHNSIVIANGYGRRVSFDLGDTFEIYEADFDHPYRAASENTDTGMILLVNDNIIERSFDGGVTVEETGIVAHLGPSGIHYVEDVAGIYTFYTYGDVPQKIDGAGNTSSLGTKATPVNTNVFWVRHPTYGFVIVTQYEERVYRSSSGMGAWDERQQMPSGGRQVRGLVLDEQTGYMFALFQQGLILRTRDGALTWEVVVEASPGLDFDSGIYIEQLKAVYIAGSSGSGNGYLTYDGGETWIVFNAPVVDGFVKTTSLSRLLSFDNGNYFFTNFSSITNELTLSEVVSRLCQRANIPQSRYITSNLTDLVTGIVFAEDYTCADAIRSLTAVYQFDGSEYDSGSGYKLNFPKRGRPVELTLTEADLVEFPDKTVRYDAYERPRVLHMAFQSPTIGYAPAKASPSRFSSDVKVVGEVSSAVPVSFADVNEAWQRADVMLKVVWTSVAGEEEFTLTDKMLALVPSDCVGVYIRGQQRRMLITETLIEGGLMRCKLVADRQSNYTSNLTGVPLPDPTPPLPTIVGPTIHVPLDIPSLTDSVDGAGLISYQAATGTSQAWYGAVIERRTENGEFGRIATFNTNTVMGAITEEVREASEYFADTYNQVVVQLYRDDEIEAISENQFNSEGGAFALSYDTSDGRKWEILQYRDAEQVSSGEWVLSYLKRGQLNTAATHHPAGSYFVLLDSIQTTSNQTSHLNEDLTYRATSLGMSSDGISTYTEEYTGQSQTEFPVADFIKSWAGDLLTVTIVPRHRFGTETNPVRSVNWSGYEIRLEDSGSSVSTTTQIEDSITFDTTSLTFPLTLSVWQLNRFTGRGPVKTEVIDEPAP